MYCAALNSLLYSLPWPCKPSVQTGQLRDDLNYSEQKDDPDEVKLKAEMQQYGDIVRIDMVDTYADLSMKTLRMFSPEDRRRLLLQG